MFALSAWFIIDIKLVLFICVYMCLYMCSSWVLSGV